MGPFGGMLFDVERSLTAAAPVQMMAPSGTADGYSTECVLDPQTLRGGLRGSFESSAVTPVEAVVPTPLSESPEDSEYPPASAISGSPLAQVLQVPYLSGVAKEAESSPLPCSVAFPDAAAQFFPRHPDPRSKAALLLRALLDCAPSAADLRCLIITVSS